MQTTEQNSKYNDLEAMATEELLRNINYEDLSVPVAVGQAIPGILAFVDAVTPKMQQGGRLFYIGAGTSGRLGVLDASECPPTYGVSPDLVVGIIAGGDRALRSAVENAEDDAQQGQLDLQHYRPSHQDSIVGIAASGSTPYVLGALEIADRIGMTTACLTCNVGTPAAGIAQFPIEVVVGPEFVTGSTRMKSGTAQKLVLNMISTTLMIKLGKIQGNRMVDMQLSNQKLQHRAALMVQEQLGLDREEAQALLGQYGSVRAAVEGFVTTKDDTP